MKKLVATAVLLAVCGCATQSSPPAPSGRVAIVIDSARVLEDLRALSSPPMEGRATGTRGNVAARDYIIAGFRAAGALAPSGQWIQEFDIAGGAAGGEITAGNVIATIRGTDTPERFIVVTAHFDHLGIRGSEVFHGADDNASGAAALLEIARFFATRRPSSSIAIVALDAEERGLLGARAFVANPPIPLQSIALNINLDMIGRNDRSELFVAGTYHYPFLEPLVDEAASSSLLNLQKGHDRPGGSAGDDWTGSSDHGAFHAAGIPFLYLGVEDHPDYHRPTDTFDGIQPGFYAEAVRTAINLIILADDDLDRISAARSSPPR